MNTVSQASEERGVIFDCQGDQLVGLMHHTVKPCDTGVVTIVAGGPQYRAGCGRQLVELARRLASEGIPVFRFDYRGMGDSEGEFTGFRFIERDIEAAIKEFKRNIPSLRRIVIWGGCDAASAALMHGYRFDNVVGIIAANPFVSSAKTASVVQRRHYLARLKQPYFWKKVFRFEYDFSYFISRAISKLMPAKKDSGKDPTINGTKTGVAVNHVDAMLTGLTKFRGRVLFLMSGRSLISKEFDELVESDPQWKKIYESGNCERWEIPDADQTFSSRESRDVMLDSVSEWVNGIVFKVPS